jgi:hypothetical protein
MNIDGARRDKELSYYMTNQWIDQNVNNAMTLKKGKHTFQLTGNSGSKFGCGTGWGDLDIVVVPKMKGVAGYNQPDTQSGCPKARKANSNLIAKTIVLTQTSIVKVLGHMIRNYNGRADLFLYRGNTRLDLSLSYTSGKQWADVQLHHVGKLGKGKYTFSIRSNRANAFGCGTTWGDLDILVLPETVAPAPPKPSKGKKIVSYQVPDKRSGCPGKLAANQALVSKKITVSEASYVVATGHMIRRYSGRADLHLRLNNKIIDYSLTYTKTTQWQDASVYWVGSINKGSHTFSITGNRANAFGCGSNWGDLDIIVIPKLKGVAVYQFGVTQSGCPASNLNFKKTITLQQDSVVWATGHIISKQSGRRADLYLNVDNKRRDNALSYDMTNQWIDQNVNNAMTLKKGKHTFQLTGNSGSKFGCGTGWGDLDIVVVPKMKGVAAYNQPDTKSGCPANRKANSNLIAKTITLTQTSIVKVFGHMIRNSSGRADLYLYRGNSRLDLSLSYTAAKQWADVQLHHVGRLGKGKYTFSLRSNKANAFGCGTTWGDLDILVLPESM